MTYLKYLIGVVILSLCATAVSAQNSMNLDSLFRVGNSLFDRGSPLFRGYRISQDSIVEKSKFYDDWERVIINGWASSYAIWGYKRDDHRYCYSSTEYYGAGFIGIYPSYPWEYSLSYDFSDPIIVESNMCFVDGIPYLNHRYNARWAYTDRPGVMRDTLTYFEGRLSGLFSVGTETERYVTAFDNGTGHYRSYFPDGAIRIEGDVVNSYMHGEWVFYIRRNGEYVAKIISEYESGEQKSTIRFIYRRGKWRKIDEQPLSNYLPRDYEIQ